MFFFYGELKKSILISLFHAFVYNSKMRRGITTISQMLSLLMTLTDYRCTSIGMLVHHSKQGLEWIPENSLKCIRYFFCGNKRTILFRSAVVLSHTGWICQKALSVHTVVYVEVLGQVKHFTGIW